MLNLIYIILLLLLKSTNAIKIIDTSIKIAQASYCIEPFKNDNTNILEYDINKNSMRALVGHNKEYNLSFVSYRGSENIKNWINNLNIRMTYPYKSFPNVGVEAGFYKSYNILYDEIIVAIRETSYKYRTTQLLLTGHSLGSIATLLAFDIINDYKQYKIHSLVTFGSPRIGNNEFVDNFKILNINSFRVTHYYDLVPHLPLESFGYSHIPNEIWYNQDNSEYIKCNDEENEDPNCSDSCSPTSCTSISDHMNYLNVSIGINGDC